jgi:UDP-N-acetylmuramyl pentapeptide phosphotransferase/UDP-N-acetylglucosamine-1-phosphate transferase
MVGALGILSFAVTLAALRLLLSRLGRIALDHPNARSLHETPVPRLGGLGVMLGMLASAPFVEPAHWIVIGLALGLAVLSFLDDVRSIPTAVRFAFHLAAAAALIAFTVLPLTWVDAVALTLALTWMANLFNFMDGSDGLAGGMAVIGFAVYAIAADGAGNMALAALSVALAGSAAAFLVLNFHPASVFLGDVGSIPLGFLAGALGVLGWHEHVWPLWFPVLVFGVFIADATFTLAKRLARGERVWVAHRSHYYQRLVRLGAGHRGTAAIAYALMVGCGAAALYARDERPALQAAAGAAALLPMALLALWIDVRWARLETAERFSR